MFLPCPAENKRTVSLGKECLLFQQVVNDLFLYLVLSINQNDQYFYDCYHILQVAHGTVHVAEGIARKTVYENGFLIDNKS